MVPIKVCNAPQIFTRDLTGLPPNLVRFVTLSDYLGMVGYHANPLLEQAFVGVSTISTVFGASHILVVRALIDWQNSARVIPSRPCVRNKRFAYRT